MASPFSYKRLGRRLHLNEPQPGVISGVIDVSRTDITPIIPRLAITYKFDDGSVDVQVYEGNSDLVAPESSLGKLIVAFNKLGIEDIGADEFTPIVGKKFLLATEPHRNGTGYTRYQLYPIKAL